MNKVAGLGSGFYLTSRVLGRTLRTWSFCKICCEAVKTFCIHNIHCVKSVRIRSFFCSNAGKYEPEKLRIRTLLTQ